MFSFEISDHKVNLNSTNEALQAINPNYSFGKLIELSSGKQAHLLGVDNEGHLYFKVLNGNEVSYSDDLEAQKNFKIIEENIAHPAVVVPEQQKDVFASLVSKLEQLQKDMEEMKKSQAILSKKNSELMDYVKKNLSPDSDKKETSQQHKSYMFS